MSYPTVLEVVPGSPAAGAGVREGDEILTVNGVAPGDVIEYQQLVDDAEVTLGVRREAATWEVEVTKRPGAPLGLRLNSSIFDRVQTCDNHCEFCFIYQLPPGMRQTLYLKDDDYRLSFLYGNFTTLTRFTELDLARVVEERLGPLYVSIHATDPEVRAGMLRNPRGATSLRWLRGLLERGVEVHGQVVLCPGINGEAVLERTCAEILVRYPKLASVGIVPLGLSRFNREERLAVHTPEQARRDLEAVAFWQERALDVVGRRMFFASDELYLVAGLPFPDVDAYEGFPQHENGIGMARAFYRELERIEAGAGAATPAVTGEWRTLPAAPAWGYREARPDGGSLAGPERVVLVTGEYGARVLDPVLSRLEALAGTELRVLPVRNEFFGGNVAVSGLLVGADVERAVGGDGDALGRYLIPDLAVPGGRFLDEVTIDEVAARTGASLTVTAPTVAGLLAAVGR
jgi:putative radical SAM enzyme (TIGR03279 family)